MGRVTISGATGKRTRPEFAGGVPRQNGHARKEGAGQGCRDGLRPHDKVHGNGIVGDPGQRRSGVGPDKEFDRPKPEEGRITDETVTHPPIAQQLPSLGPVERLERDRPFQAINISKLNHDAQALRNRNGGNDDL